MASTVDADQVYMPAPDVLSQDVDGELFVLPLRLRADGRQPGVFVLNAAGRAVWECLDGRRQLREIVHALSRQYEVPAIQIEQDVQGLMDELLRERILVTVPQNPGAP